VDMPLGPELYALFAQKAEECRKAGRRPYVWDKNHTKPLAAISYFISLIEILGQLRRQRLEPSAIYVCSCGSTGAGLALAHKAMGLTCPLRLVAPIKWPWNAREDMADIASKAAAMVGLPHRLTPADINLSEDYIGPGYGRISPDGREAMDLLAR